MVKGLVHILHSYKRRLSAIRFSDETQPKLSYRPVILFEHLHIWVVRQAIFTNGREIYDSSVCQ